MKKLKSDIIIVFLARTVLRILCLMILLSPGILLNAQKIKEETPPLSERIFFGGSFGLQFGTLTNIQVAPVVGLWVLPRLAVAAGPDFNYYKFYDDKTTMYGGKAYAQFLILQDLDNIVPLGVHMGIFLHLEDELMKNLK